MLEKLRAFARSLKNEIAVLAAAIQDPRTPWTAKAFGAFVVAYAVSPIDLIPDFIPVLGYLDELILLPAALWALKLMIPEDVLADHRARIVPGTRIAKNRTAAVVIVALWLACIAAVSHWLWDWAGRPWIF